MIIAVYPEIHTKHVTALSGQNGACLKAKASSICSNHLGSKRIKHIDVKACGKGEV
jgi:hypothetical protein